MSWLRLDDGFTKHPKFEGWSVAQKWAWLEVMEYCARYETSGRIPADLSLLPRSATPQLLARAERAGWIDVRDGARWIHDWEFYNPSSELEERVADVLMEHPDASANEVVSLVGGNRQAILRIVRRFRGGSEEGKRGTASGSDAEPLRNRKVVPPSRARAPARASPSRPQDVDTNVVLGRDLSRPSPGTGDDDSALGATSSPNGVDPGVWSGATAFVRNEAWRLAWEAIVVRLQDDFGIRPDDTEPLHEIYLASAEPA